MLSAETKTLSASIAEIERCHTAMRVMKRLLKDGQPTTAYIEVCQTLNGIPQAFGGPV